MANEFQRMLQLVSIDEAMQVNFKGRLQDLDIPSGWNSLKVYQDQDPEEDIEIESYGAPMEGWDEDHLDVVTIMKTPEIDPLTDESQEVKYYVATYISFGDFTKSEQFDNLDDAKAEAISIMNDLKSDWRGDGDEDRNKQLEINKNTKYPVLNESQLKNNMTNEFKRMQKLAGIITESQVNKKTIKSKRFLKENTTAKKLFQTFKDEDLLNDRREYDVEDFMSAYPDLSKEEAEKLEQMLSSWAYNKAGLNENQDNLKQDIIDFWGVQQDDAAQSDEEYEAEWDTEFFIDEYPQHKGKNKEINTITRKLGINELSVNEGDTDYNRAKDTKRLGKKGEENIYGAGVKKGEEIEKKKMKMSELKAAIKELYLNESEDDININDDESLYDPVYENLSMRDKDKIEQIIQMLDSVDGETMEYILRQVGMEDQMANQLVHNRAEMSEAKKDKKDKKEDTDIDTDIDIDIDTPDNTLGNDIPTEVKAVQDALLQAQTAAERLNDEKLIDQIGNTITFFTRSHISEKPGITAESKKKHLNESVEFPEMDSEFEGAMETGDYDSPQDYLQYIIDTPSSKIDLSGYYDVEDSIMQGYYSKGQAIKLMKSWAKNKMNKLNKSL